MFGTVLHQILIMVMLMAVGFICAKKHLISVEGNRVLSNILLMVVNPLLIFTAFQIEKTEETIRGLFTSLGMAAVIMAAAIVIAALVFRKDKSERGQINKFFSAYSNCGFIGIPLVYSMMGDDGVICLSGFIAIFNILVWTHGYVQMAGERNMRQLIKGILSPTMIGIVAGIIFFFADIRVPELVYRTMTYLSDMNTPLAMLIAGASLAGANFASTVKNRNVYLVTFLKLILMPAIAILLMALFRVDRMIAYAVIVAAACPSATTGVAFALQLRKDYTYASQLFVFTTVLSMVTIPLTVFITEMTGFWP